MRSFEELRIEETEIVEQLEYIDEQSGKIFSVAAISPEEEELQKKSPYYKLFREYKLKFVAVQEEILTNHRECFSFEKYMECCFLLAAECYFLGEPDKMKAWANRIDWARWNVRKSKDPAIIIVYNALLKALREEFDGRHF